MNRDDFQSYSSLSSKIIELKAGLDPSIFYVIKDTLVFIKNGNPDPYYFDVYNLKTKKQLLSFARRGKGPNEFLTCKLNYKSNQNNFLSIHDINKSTISVYNIDSLIHEKKLYKPHTYRIPNVVKDYTFISPDTIVAFNHYYFNKKNIKNDISPILKFRLGNNPSENRYIKNVKYYAYNVSGAYILNIPDKNWYVLANYYEDKIDIYNEVFNLTNEVVGPDNILPQYQLNSNNSISSESGKYHRAYYSSFIGKQAIYLLYAGFKGVSYDEPIGKPLELFKFDFDGNMLNRYQLDRFIGYISLDENEKYLYGTDLKFANRQEEHKLIRYHLPN